MYMNATSTWLPILMGGPLGPPAKRGDMKDCDKNNRVPWDSGQWSSINVVFKFVWIQDQSVSSDECQSMKHQHWEPMLPYERTDSKNEERRERRSITWEWGPIILLGGGGWGWGEPWGPGGPCGIVQKKGSKEGEWAKKKCRRGAEKEARLLQGRRQSECKK